MRLNGVPTQWHTTSAPPHSKKKGCIHIIFWSYGLRMSLLLCLCPTPRRHVPARQLGCVSALRRRAGPPSSDEEAAQQQRSTRRDGRSSSRHGCPETAARDPGLRRTASRAVSVPVGCPRNELRSGRAGLAEAESSTAPTSRPAKSFCAALRVLHRAWGRCG
ncbi:unnamed protein product, partial [Prorocentrum cordatum]